MLIKFKKTALLLLTLTVLTGQTGIAFNLPETAKKASISRCFAAPEDGCALFVDLDSCILTVYLDGLPYQSFPVSGGTASTPSPTGTWQVVNISSWGEGFGGTWLGLDVPWGIYGIHGTPEPWALGRYNISHGCIRMRDEDAAAVKKLVSLGTQVHIKHNSAPFRPMENGMVGSDVLKTQLLLSGMGFYTGSADGVFGDGMERAVRSFQKTYSLTIDGIVGSATYDKIVEQAAT